MTSELLDRNCIDEQLPVVLFESIQSLMTTASTLIIIGIVNTWVLLALIPLVPVICVLCRFYWRSSRQLKRLENVSRSPIYSLLSSSLRGLATIRAFKVKDDFLRMFENRTQTNTRAHMVMLSATFWLSFRLDLLISLFSLCTAMISVRLRDEIKSSAVALSLMYSMNMIVWFQWGVRQFIEAENLMTSAKRIDEYSQLPPEEDKTARAGLIETPKNWISRGTIEFRNYSLRYRPNLPRALQNINFTIVSSEKIGVIGRTGIIFGPVLTFLRRIPCAVTVHLSDHRDRHCTGSLHLFQLGLDSAS